MMYKANEFRVLGEQMSEEALRSLSHEKISVFGTPAWERDIWTFIIQWLSIRKTIQVQTSGSTGLPKTIEIEKKYMVESARATLGFFNLKRGDKALLCLPVKYIAGKMMIVRALIGGLDLHFIQPSSNPDLTAIGQIDFSAMTPMQVSNILQTDSGVDQLAKINTLILGGSAFPKYLDDKLQSVNSTIWQTYGMTETITHIALRPVNGKLRTDWFQPLSGVQIAQNPNGCLVVDYPRIGVFELLTNDLVTIDKTLGFKILGRADNVVNSGGVKLFPEILEQKLKSVIPHPFFLHGIADPILGEKLIMVLEGELTNNELIEIRKSVEQKLSRIEKPLAYYTLRQFRKTENGKLQRRETLNLAINSMS